ncbi:MAG: hypothetical protein KA149_01560 [Chitinophagales bacterium]|nr:hypothetical protein [Chitinophagales bacterium]
MIMPGREFSSGGYRFGFNGKENDDEVKGTGNSLDFGARIYDSRLARWMSVDPFSRNQAGWSTYKSFYNNPLLFKDPNGETEYTFLVRRYEHSSYFGTPFFSEGDARKASVDVTKSARVHHSITVETSTPVGANPVTRENAYSSESVQYFPWYGRGTEAPTASQSGEVNKNDETFNVVKFTFKDAGAQPVAKNFCESCTPEINTSGSIVLAENKKSNSLEVRGVIRGDDFPDGEAMLYDPSGQGVLLSTYNHKITGSPMKDLWGEGNQKIMEVNVNIKLDKKGNFKSASTLDKDGNRVNLKIFSKKETNHASKGKK